MAAIKTVDANNATWNYVSFCLIEEQRSQNMVVIDSVSPNGKVALTERSIQHTECFKGEKRGRIARYCKSSYIKRSSTKMKKSSSHDERQPEKDITRIAAGSILSPDGMKKGEAEGKEHKGSRDKVR